MTPTTRPCVHCRRPIPLAGGILCPGCVELKEQVVAAGNTPNCPESSHNADLAQRDLDTHWRWVREGHVPEFARP